MRAQSSQAVLNILRLYVEADWRPSLLHKVHRTEGLPAVHLRRSRSPCAREATNESIEVAVAIMIATAAAGRCGKRTKSYHEENGEDGHDARCAALLRKVRF